MRAMRACASVPDAPPAGGPRLESTPVVLSLLFCVEGSTPVAEAAASLAAAVRVVAMDADQEEM
eukprot:1934349-Prymnesium_polylepis.1